MIATTIEQSRHLIELGLDPKTADMCFEMYKGNWTLNVGKKSAQVNRGLAIPAWSLSALLDVIPSKLEPELHKNPIDETWFMDIWVEYNHMTGDYKHPVEAAYAIVIWLLEQGLIEKGDNDESKN